MLNGMVMTDRVMMSNGVTNTDGVVMKNGPKMTDVVELNNGKQWINECIKPITQTKLSSLAIRVVVCLIDNFKLYQYGTGSIR